MDIFSNREVAIGIWILVFIGYLLISGKGKNAFKRLIRPLLSGKILVLIILELAYISLGVILLAKLSIWQWDQLKDTLLWMVVAGLPVLVSSSKTGEEPNYFKDALKETLGLSAFVEFAVGLYSFSLLVEFLILPVTTILIIVIMTTLMEDRYRIINRLAYGILIFISASILIYSLAEINIHAEEFYTKENFRALILSIFLGLWILPFIYLLYIFISYESIFRSFDYALKDKSLLRFAKYQAFLKLRFDIKGLQRWNKVIHRNDLNNRQAILASILHLKELQKTEKNPPSVDSDEGWSPYLAKDFLKENGIVTDHYSCLRDEEWMALSNYIKLMKPYLKIPSTFPLKETKQQ